MSIETLTLKVYGMTCQGCESSVHNALKELSGVQDVEVNRLLEQAVVTYDDELLDKVQIINAVEDAGFSTT
ncbi:heavy-metal-associated domain-containing protein [Moraxella sp. Tifton1]|uniref:Heavy-metal-associated domain-containing protein n=1 Tax=Moraxella oculi TaxID=2940516 RepID=A0ABW8U4N7_9GAMM|nr:heavy-metal-associated domain-containing protein [Moraxella sp. Tifton1]MCL1622664.1 heavy-metal-associated domain-containing protein [Moraxella sp. Tifton1]